MTFDRRRANGAGSLLVGLALGIVPASSSAQSQVDYARSHFRAGVQLYDSHAYARALDEFRESLVLTESPNARLYLARCLREIGLLPDAVTEYENAIRVSEEQSRSDTRYTQTATAARTELTALEARVGRVVVDAPAAPRDARLVVGGRQLTTAALGTPVPVMPGRVSVTLTAEGFDAVSNEITVAPGQRASTTLALHPRVASEAPAAVSTTPHEPVTVPVASPAPLRVTATVRPAVVAHDSGAPLRVAGFVTAGCGVLALGASAVLAAVTANEFSQIESECNATHCPSTYADRIAGGRALELGTNIALGTGIGLVAVGAVLAVVGWTRPRTASATVRADRSGFFLQGVF